MAFMVASVSLLTIFHAPAKPFWYLALVVTEWGYWLVLPVFAVLLAVPWKTSRGRFAGLLLLISGVLLASPLWRAYAVAETLAPGLEKAFGRSLPRVLPNAAARPAPLVWKDLWRGIASPRVKKTTYVFSQIEGQPLALDLYEPLTARGLLPGVLIVHGGSWRSGDRREFESLNRYLAARGYAVAAIDYRLAPRWIFPAARDDVSAALDWLQAHAAALQVDSAQWVILGRSAGGEIALSAAYGKKDPRIRGVIVLYAPNDLQFAYAVPANPLIMNSQKVIETYMGGPPEKKPALYQTASPLNAVDTRTPPTLMIHGWRDELVWPIHEERLSARLAHAGRPYYVLRLPWATHGCDIHFSGPSGQLTVYAIEHFLAAVMPPISAADTSEGASL